MDEKRFVKCFYEESTDSVYKSLKAAKESGKRARIYRCWTLDGEIKARKLLFAHGESADTIKNADYKISEALKNGTVGKGSMDILYVL